MSQDSTRKLDRETISSGLRRLNDLLSEKSIIGEICIYGGGCMCLAFNARPSTKDIDAIFVPSSVIREMAKEVGVELGLSDDWLNDGVKGFISPHAKLEVLEIDQQYSNLRLLIPTPRYLLAMKCMAARTGINETDKQDILFLAGKLNLATPEEVMDAVEEFYSAGQIQPKTAFLLEELRDELKNNPQSRGGGI